jgi:hypothetical protein
LSETGYKRAERIGDMLATVSRFSWDSTAEVVLDAMQKVLATLPVPQPLPEDTPEKPAMAAA